MTVPVSLYWDQKFHNEQGVYVSEKLLVFQASSKINTVRMGLWGRNFYLIVIRRSVNSLRLILQYKYDSGEGYPNL